MFFPPVYSLFVFLYILWKREISSYSFLVVENFLKNDKVGLSEFYNIGGDLFDLIGQFLAGIEGQL